MLHNCSIHWFEIRRNERIYIQNHWGRNTRLQPVKRKSHDNPSSALSVDQAKTLKKCFNDLRRFVWNINQFVNVQLKRRSRFQWKLQIINEARGDPLDAFG